MPDHTNAAPDYTAAEIEAIRQWEAADDHHKACLKVIERHHHDGGAEMWAEIESLPSRGAMEPKGLTLDALKSAMAKGYDTTRGRPKRLLLDNWDEHGRLC